MSGQPQILIVEDQLIIARHIQSTLERLGYGITALAASRMEVKQAISGHIPDLVLMDIELRDDEDGISIAREIHDQYDIPVIFLTANTGREILERIKQSYSFGFIKKPFDEQVLHSTIQLVIHRHSLQKKLLNSERRLTQFLERLPDAVFRSTRDGKLLMVNAALVRMLGYDSSEELLKLDIGRDIYTSEEERAEVLKSFDNGTDNPTNILRLKKKNGDLIWVEEHSHKVVDETGRLSYYEGVLRDVTERKHAEDILKNIAEGVSAATGERFFKSLVRHLVHSLGVESAMVFEITGESRQQARVIAKHGSDEIFSENTVCNLDGTPFEHIAELGNMISYPSGIREIFPECTELKKMKAEGFLGLPLFNNEKEVIGILAISSEKKLGSNRLYENMLKIFAVRASAELERRHYERKIIVSKEKAEEMNRLKTNFLANMSHEIRTPMNSILGFSTLLEEQLTDTELDFFTSRIKQSAERLLNTINDLLDLAKIEASQTDLQLENLCIGEQAEIAAGLMSGIALQKKLKLETIVHEREVYARIDPNIFAQIMNNIIGNALKFTPEGSVTVEVDRTKHKGSEYGRIRVIDTGIGIDPDFVDHVFDEFKQESEGLSRRYEGTGLGLTITSKFVELLNGEIGVESTKGKGTIFTLLFPASEPDAPDGVMEADADKEFLQEVPAGDKPDILLVEDNEENKDVTEIILRDHYHVDFAATGDIALEKARHRRYSAILMDINLGRGMNGSEVKSHLRELPGYHEVPVIAITAYAMRGDREKYLSNGFDNYLPKPFSRQELLDILSETIVMKEA